MSDHVGNPEDRLSHNEVHMFVGVFMVLEQDDLQKGGFQMMV